MFRYRLCWLPGLVFTLLLGHAANADTLPSYSLRYLSIRAEVIVEATPVKPLQDADEATFRVSQVLGGRGIKSQDDIRVAESGLYRRELWRSFRQNAEQPEPYEVDKVLLFLTSRRDGAMNGKGHFYLITSGIRYLTKDKQVLRPQQMTNPGEYYLFPVQGGNWEQMLDTVRDAAAEAETVKALRTIENPAQRNEALLNWIINHRNEFDELLPLQEVRYAEPIVIGIRDNKPILMGDEAEIQEAKVAPRPKGWGVLERRTFDWVMQSCIASDCLRALKLYTEVFSGDILQTEFPSFSSPEGRDLLLQVAVDEHEPLTYRRQALYQLSGSFWVRPNAPRPQLIPLEKSQQFTIIQKLLPLLKIKDVRLRSGAIWAIESASVDINAGLNRNTGQALPALAEAFKVETDEYVRNQLTETIGRLTRRIADGA